MVIVDYKLKPKKCKNCGETFQPFRSLQPVCSYKCEAEYKRKKQEGKPKPNKKIAPVSDKRLSELAEYRKLRAEFLRKPENHYCPVAKYLTGTHIRVTEIHHTNGRNGKRLNEQKFWLAVSRSGHRWIHENPVKARKMGWLI